MRLDWHVPCTTEREFVHVPVLPHACPHEGPLSAVPRAKVFRRHPSAGFLRLPPGGPGPQSLEDHCVHCDQGLRGLSKPLQSWQLNRTTVATELALDSIDREAAVLPFPLQDAKGDQTAGEVMELS